MPQSGYKTMAACLVAATLAACAGSGEGLDANGNPIAPGGGGSETLTADFQSIQDNVFTPICSKCHIGAGAPEGLQLDAAHSYALLVGVPSTEQPNVMRVAPGDPDSSYIVRKLEGASGITGVQMPFGGPYLPQATIDVIRQWISAGAMKSLAASINVSSKSIKRFTVTASSPDRDSVVTMVLPRLLVAFSTDVDASLVNDTTVALVRVDSAPPPQMTTSSALAQPQSMEPAAAPVPPSDATSATPPPHIPVSTSIPVGDPSAVMITPLAALASGTYRLTLRGTGGGALADMNAQTLGSDYSFTFTVDASP